MDELTKNITNAYLQVLRGDHELSEAKKPKLDPVGKADGDIDNDGDEDESDDYLKNRRKAISKSISKDSKSDKDDDDKDSKSDKDDTKPKKGKVPPQFLPGYKKEEVDLDEAKTDVYHKLMLKALGKTKLPKDHGNTSSVANNGDFVVYDGGNRTIGRIKKGEFDLPAKNEQTELEEKGPKMKGDSIAIQRAKDRAHDKAMGRTNTGRKKPVRTMTSTQKSLASLRNEEADELDELSKKTLGSYVKKASDDMADNAYALGARDPHKKKGSWSKSFKRGKGIEKATDKLTKEAYMNEEVELDENKNLIKDYEKYMSQGGKENHNALDYLMSMPKYKRLSKDQMAKIIGDAKRAGIFKEDKAHMNEAATESGLNDNKPIIATGVKGMKSTSFRKKFRNMAAYEKWTDTDAFGDFDVERIFNEDKAPGSTADLDESITKLSNSRLKYHATKNFPHGSYSNAEVKDEHKRRMKSEPNYDEVKPSMSEDKAPGATADLEPNDKTRDTWSKQLSTRKGEKDFVDTHNVQTPEAGDAVQVNLKTFKSIRDSGKKPTKRWNDQAVGDQKLVPNDGK